MENGERTGKRSEGTAYGFVCTAVAVIIFVMVSIGAIHVGIKIGEGRKTDIETSIANWEEEIETMEENLQRMENKIDGMTNYIQELERKADSLLSTISQNGSDENAENADTDISQQNPDAPPAGQ